LRKGVPDAVADLAGAGVATIVVTGDHPATARAIAAQAGLPAGYLLARGDDADAITDAELNARLGHGTVIARASPSTKHRIVALLQRRGEIVAVTGDGANDAPALAAADVGIALGRRGAELARAAADVVLTNDAYPTVVAAIAKGRNITAQLRRAVAFYLGAKLALVAVLVGALAAGLPTPFRPVHIVLLEIFMDLGAVVAFVAEPVAPGAMQRPPRPAKARFLDGSVLAAIATTAFALTLAVLPSYVLLARAGATPQQARAGAVLTWLVVHVVIAWALRSRPSLSWLTNPAFPIWAAAAMATGIVVATTHLGRLVHLDPLRHVWLPALLTIVVAAAGIGIILARRRFIAQRL
jgi:Ca2+-transporting ATPase